MDKTREEDAPPPAATAAALLHPRSYTANLRIVLPYVIVGALWILFSDRLVLLLFREQPDTLLLASTAKGWLYILITAILLNVLVSRELQRRSALETRLREENETKAVLLAEIHHRVKNNLQIVSSILSLERGGAESEEARALCDATMARVRSMALVHEQLYTDRDFASVDLAGYLRSLTASIVDIYGNEGIEFAFDFEPMRAGLDIAIPFGIFLSEAVTNAVRHGQGQGPRNRIGLSLRSVEGREVELQVSDEGPGFASVASQGGLGMSLMRALAAQLNGKLEFSSGPGGQVRLRFPLSLA